MNQEQQLVLAFIKALPQGKTKYPLDMEINKMGTSVEVVFRLKLTTKQDTLEAC